MTKKKISKRTKIILISAGSLVAATGITLGTLYGVGVFSDGSLMSADFSNANIAFVGSQVNNDSSNEQKNEILKIDNDNKLEKVKLTWSGEGKPLIDSKLNKLEPKCIKVINKDYVFICYSLLPTMKYTEDHPKNYLYNLQLKKATVFPADLVPTFCHNFEPDFMKTSSISYDSKGRLYFGCMRMFESKVKGPNYFDTKRSLVRMDISDANNIKYDVLTPIDQDVCLYELDKDDNVAFSYYYNDSKTISGSALIYNDGTCNDVEAPFEGLFKGTDNIIYVYDEKVEAGTTNFFFDQLKIKKEGEKVISEKTPVGTPEPYKFQNAGFGYQKTKNTNKVSICCEDTDTHFLKIRTVFDNNDETKSYLYQPISIQNDVTNYKYVTCNDNDIYVLGYNPEESWTHEVKYSYIIKIDTSKISELKYQSTYTEFKHYKFTKIDISKTGIITFTAENKDGTLMIGNIIDNKIDESSLKNLTQVSSLERFE